MTLLSTLIELDGSISRHLCSGLCETEGFPASDVSCGTFDEWMAHYRSGMPSIPEVYAILRDMSGCKVFTHCLGNYVYRFEVRGGKAMDRFFVYPDCGALAVEYVDEDGKTRYSRFTDARSFIVAIRMRFFVESPNQDEPASSSSNDLMVCAFASRPESSYSNAAGVSKAE
jgi:hypothetical protein